MHNTSVYLAGSIAVAALSDAFAAHEHIISHKSAAPFLYLVCVRIVAAEMIQ
jgi:hypothetical protein